VVAGNAPVRFALDYRYVDGVRFGVLAHCARPTGH
jgi:hypothetical protein